MDKLRQKPACSKDENKVLIQVSNVAQTKPISDLKKPVCSGFNVEELFLKDS